MKTNTELVKEKLGEVLFILYHDDWEVIYFNGEILRQMHSINVLTVISIYDKFPNLPPFCSRNIIYTEFDESDSLENEDTGNTLEFDELDRMWLEEVIEEHKEKHYAKIN